MLSLILSIKVLATVYFGAIINRIRGGDIFESKYNTHHGLLWAAFIFLLVPNIAFALTMGVAMMIGESLGWGVAIGATRGNETQPLEKVWFIDKIVNFFIRPKFNKKINTYEPIWLQRTWGTVWLTLRGLVWAGLPVLTLYFAPILFGLTFTFWWIPLLTFSLFGVISLLTSLFLGNKEHWERQEKFYGAAIGLGLGLSILL